MPCHNPECLRRHRFARIAFYARKHYIEGINTITLLCSAGSEDEKIKIVLASMLDLDDEGFDELLPPCSHRCRCRMLDMRNHLRQMIALEGGRQLASLSASSIR